MKTSNSNINKLTLQLVRNCKFWSIFPQGLISNSGSQFTYMPFAGIITDLPERKKILVGVEIFK